MPFSVYSYRIDTIEFNDGTQIKPGNLTVICGPNNVGKSRLLKDLALFAATSEPRTSVIIRKTAYVLPAKLNDLTDTYGLARHLNQRGNWFHRGLLPELCSEFTASGGQDWPDAYAGMFVRPGPDIQGRFASEFGQLMVAHLTTEHRLQLVKESPSASEENQVANLLQALYNQGQEAEKRVRT